MRLAALPLIATCLLAGCQPTPPPAAESGIAATPPPPDAFAYAELDIADLQDINRMLTADAEARLQNPADAVRQ